MKKSLEAELMSIAHKILQLKNKEDVHELKTITGVLYEKLSVLSFAEKHFAGSQPTIGLKQVEEKLDEQQQKKEAVLEDAQPSGLEHNTEALIEPNTEIIKNIVAEMPMEIIKEIKAKNHRPDGLEYNKEAITEPNTEKIKDMVAQMFPESEEIDEVIQKIIPQKKTSAKKVENKETPKPKKTETKKEESEDLGVHYDDLPQFEPVKKEEKKPEPPKQTEEKEETSEAEKEKPNAEENTQEDLFKGYETPEFEPKEKTTRNSVGDEKKSLNDRLKKGINIGLNDRLAYIKHLFDGNAADYNRVLSQLNTIDSYDEANNFIQQQIKPDYNNWENKEVYEERFLQAIENKYD